MTLHQSLLVLKAHRKASLLVLLITVVGAVALSLLLPKQYTANTSVVIDVKSPDPVSGVVLQGMMAPGYMATQIDIINSDRVALGVVSLLNLENRQDLRAQWEKKTKSKGQFVEWLANSLQETLVVKPSRESNVISIQFTGYEPGFAADVANGFAEAYINVNLELRLAAAREFATFFEVQTKSARDRLESAQAALSAFQQANGITVSEDRVDFESAKLNETSSLLTTVQGQTIDSQSKRNSGDSDTLSEVIQSPLINTLKTDIARLEAKSKEANINLGKNHPQAIQTEAELETLRQQLTAETKKIAKSIETSYQIGKQREQKLQSALADQKSRVLNLNKQRAQLNVLKRDVDSAQRAFDVVSQRASQTSMESQATQTNISFLSRATPPGAASKPRLVSNALIAVFMGTLLGVVLAFVLEFAKHRVRCQEDLSDALDMPVLGSIAKKGGRA